MSYSDNLERLRNTDPERYRQMVQDILRDNEDVPRIHELDEVQASYCAMLMDGTGPRLAEMFALATPPMSNTDREFLHGYCNGNQFEGQEWAGDFYRAEAEAAGVDVTGKIYMHQLAEYPGDPRAWVSGRGDVQKICEERGWGCSGAIQIKAREQQPEDPIPVADDLIDEEIESILEDAAENGAQPGDIDVNELRHNLIQKRKPHWVK